jgi:hypothetical protein
MVLGMAKTMIKYGLGCLLVRQTARNRLGIPLLIS